MIANPPPISEDEWERRGKEIYATRILPTLQPQDDAKFVAVDVLSGEYEIDADDYAAISRIHTRIPNAAVWVERVGEPTAYRIGVMEELSSTVR